MRTATGLAALTLAAAAWGCGPRPDKAPDPDALALKGTVPISPIEKASFTLTDTDGRPYDFRAETDGHITLLYFGYTYCPDVCPLQMATLAAALKEVDPAVRDQVRVVFVSVDPDRDKPERLKKWLRSFDTTFVGLRGTEKQVADVLSFYRFPAPKKSGEEEGYTMSHPAWVYAFTPDDLGRALYGEETTKAIWIHDLNLMAGHDWTHAAARAAQVDTTAPEAPALATVGDVRVLDAYVPKPAAGDVTAAYLTLRNDGSVPDTLVAVASDVSARGSLHDMEMKDGTMRMVPMKGGLVIPPGETVALKPGGRHGMLEGLNKELEPGTTINLILRFARGGMAAVPARVVRYEDLTR